MRAQMKSDRWPALKRQRVAGATQSLRRSRSKIRDAMRATEKAGSNSLFSKTKKNGQ